MKRYRHWIPALKSVRWPQSIVCVDCAGRIVPLGTDGRQRTELLTSWHAVCLRRVHDDYRVVRLTSGEHATSFWRELQQYLSSVNRVWLLSHNCTRVWSLLELWMRIEDGEVTLPQKDYWEVMSDLSAVQSMRRTSHNPLGPISSGAVSRLLGARNGYLVTEDPPCTAVLSLPPSQGLAQWIDSRNYGVEAPSTLVSGYPVANWLANWIADLCELLQRFKLGGLCATAASQAMTGWRYGYYPGGCYVSANKRTEQLESSAYCGGRCEAVRLGTVETPLYALDRRAAYARHAVCDKLPQRAHGHSRDNGNEGAITDLDSQHTIATVTLETEQPYYPVKVNGLVCYPVGIFTTTLCGPELALALDRGHVVAVTDYTTYEMDYCLRDYALAAYAMRCECDRDGKSALSTVAKRLYCSIVGKLAQRNKVWTHLPGVYTAQQWGEWQQLNRSGELVRHHAVGGQVYRCDDNGFAHDAMPAISAWITSAARVELLRAIECAGWEHTYYYDTDSIFVDGVGLGAIRDSIGVGTGILGGWELRAGPCHAEILGIKHYILDGVVTCAGQPKGMQIATADGQYYWHTASAGEAIYRGQVPTQVQTLRSYHRAAPYRHGVVSDDGMVKPFRLEQVI